MEIGKSLWSVVFYMTAEIREDQLGVCGSIQAMLCDLKYTELPEINWDPMQHFLCFTFPNVGRFCSVKSWTIQI